MLSPRLAWRPGLRTCAILGLALASCTGRDLSAPAKVQPQLDHTLNEDSVLHTFWICKEGTDATFQLDTVQVGTTNTGSFQVSVAEGTCVKAVRSPDERMNVTVTELPSQNVTLDSIVYEQHVLNNPTTVTTLTGTNTLTREINGDFGSVATFYNRPLEPTLELTKIADASVVDAGSKIGFTLTVKNTGAGTATGVVLTDNLPTGSGISWTVNPANPACSIGANVLSCSFGDLAANQSASVHVESPTTSASCKQYPNTGSASAANAAKVEASDTITVNCPSLQITKTADAATVTAGSNIGFTMTVKNNGPGSATAVQLSDPLPTGAGISWSVDAANSDPTCSITSNTLNCSFGNVAAGGSKKVHVTSPTTGASCGSYNNTATASASNHGSVSASASVVVDCPETPCPAGTFTYSFINASGDLVIKYDQFPAPNDNSYGVNAVGWGTHAHRFSDLVGSDHAGFQLVDGNGVIKLQFNVDYISANASAPSGYASLGVNGGDGKMLIGTATGISATSSLANNLNNINIPGLFNASHVQQFGSVNLLVDSPPTDAAHSTYNISDPLLAGWDFHDTYYVTVTAAKLASIGFDPNTWKVEPSLTQLHNSPAKPCPAVAGACAVAATKYEVKDKQVKITLSNSGSTDTFLTELALNWPTANGKLTQVKLDGDVIYDNPDISGGSALLTLAQLVADQNKRKINHNSSDVLTLVFEKNADTDLSHYSSTVKFGTCVLAILPK